MRSVKQLALALLISFASVQQAAAIKAYPHPVKVMQPDGTTLMVRIHGDEASHYTSTLDGYMLAKDKEGFFCYVDYNFNTGKKTITSQRAHNLKERSAQEKSVTASLKTASAIQQDYIGRHGKQPKQPATLLNKNLVSGKMKAAKLGNGNESQYLVVLVNFADSTFKFQNKDFDAWLNEVGYSENGGTGSVKDYYTDNSMGAYVPNFHVVGPYNLAHETAYYAANDNSGSDQDPRSMVKEACLLAKQNNPDMDFSQFDNDGDGLMDNCYIIYAGYSEASTGNDDDMWPHSWYMGDEKFQIDGITINNYSCSAELVGTYLQYPTPTMDGIGTFAHEFGHVLGLKDMYDTDNYVGGYGIDPGRYSMYASGSYNNGSRTPPYLMAFERVQMGWLSAGNGLKQLKEAEDVTLDYLGKNEACYIDCQPEREAGTGCEWFILENRQQRGWDKYIPSHGLMITHYDYTAEMQEKYWSVNGPNNNAKHRCMYIVPADGSDDNTSREGDTYPGSSANTEFTDYSTPSALNWAGKNTNVPITNIQETLGKIKFQVAGGSTVWDVVKTQAPDDIRDTSAVFYASLDVKTTQVTEAGFCWGLQQEPTISGKHQAVDNTKQMTLKVTDLTPGANYNVRAYARTAEGKVIYGSSVPFATECAMATAPYNWNFDSWTNNHPDCWEVVDANKDGYTWDFDKDAGAAVYSGDYYNNAEDWLICKTRMKVPERGVLYFLRGIADAGYMENLDVYVSTKSSKIDDFVLYKRFSLADYNYEAIFEEVDLSEFAGKEIYIALQCSSEKNNASLWLWNVMLMNKLETPRMTKFTQTQPDVLYAEWTPVEGAQAYWLCFAKETEERNLYGHFVPLQMYERIEGDVEVNAGSINFMGSGSVTLSTVEEGLIDMNFMVTSSGPFGKSELTIEGTTDGERWSIVGPKITVNTYDAEGTQYDWKPYIENKGYKKMRFTMNNGGRNAKIGYLYISYYKGKVLELLTEGSVKNTNIGINAKTPGEFNSGKYAAWVIAGDGILFYDESNYLYYDAATAAIESVVEDSDIRLGVSKGNLTISKLQQGDHVRVVTASGLTLIDTHTHHGSLQLNAGATTGMVIVQIEREGKTYTTKAVLR